MLKGRGKGTWHLVAATSWRRIALRSCSAVVGIEERQQIATQLGVRTAEDCYRVNRTQFQSLPQASRLLAQHGQSHERALRSLFPEWDLSPWRFPQPAEFWEREHHQRLFLTWLEVTHHLNGPEQWEKVDQALVYKEGGQGFWDRYHGEIWRAVYQLFPHKQSDFLRYWMRHSAYDRSRVQFIIQEKRKTLRIASPIDWCRLDVPTRRAELGDLLDAHGGLVPLLQFAEPELPWEYLFEGLGSQETNYQSQDKAAYQQVKQERSWNNPIKLRPFLLRVRSHFQLSQPSQWERLSKKPERLTEALGGSAEEALRVHGSLWEMYQKVSLDDVPPFSFRNAWHSPLFLRHVWREIERTSGMTSLSSLLTRGVWIQKVHRHPLGYMLLDHGGKEMLPSLFPGEPWGPSWSEFTQAPPSPSTVESQAMDLELGDMVSYFPGRRSRWHVQWDPTEMWMTSMATGIRAIWDGKDHLHALRSQTQVPEEIRRMLPSIPLALVVRLPNKSLSSFQQLRSIEHWKSSQWIVLDAPHPHLSFEKRWNRLVSRSLPPWMALASYERCMDQSHLLHTLEAQGESQGLLVVHPQASYQDQQGSYLIPPFATQVATFQEIDPQKKVARGSLPHGELIEASYDESMLPYLRSQAIHASQFRCLYSSHGSKQIQFLYFLPGATGEQEKE